MNRAAIWPNCPDRNFQFHHQPLNYYQSFAPGTPARAAHLRDEAEFLQTLAGSSRTCGLKAVSFVKPGGPENEHPGYASENGGSQHVVELLRAIDESRCADDTLVVVTYDEFGGQWDHVIPPGLGGTPGVHDVWGPEYAAPGAGDFPLLARRVRRGSGAPRHDIDSGDDRAQVRSHAVVIAGCRGAGPVDRVHGDEPARRRSVEVSARAHARNRLTRPLGPEGARVSRAAGSRNRRSTSLVGELRGLCGRAWDGRAGAIQIMSVTRPPNRLSAGCAARLALRPGRMMWSSRGASEPRETETSTCMTFTVVSVRQLQALASVLGTRPMVPRAPQPTTSPTSSNLENVGLDLRAVFSAPGTLASCPSTVSSRSQPPNVDGPGLIPPTGIDPTTRGVSPKYSRNQGVPSTLCFTTRPRVLTVAGASVIRSDSTFTARDGGKHSENFSSLTARSETGVRKMLHLARTPL